MKLRKTRETDRTEVLKIYDQAKAYFKSQGIDQWQDGYPDEECLTADMEDGISYVVEENGAVIATAVIMVGKDACYDVIEDGEWLSHAEEYGVIHRVAVAEDKKGNGLGVWLLNRAEGMCRARGARYMRMDTHEDNLSMQRLLLKCGYQSCGIVYVEDGTKRIAFEKRVTAPLLECCADSVESAVAAFEGGADRIELCSGLVIGGISPSVALFERVKANVDIPVRVLLRPRFGDFLYTEEEMNILEEEVKEFGRRGASGVVIGCLKADGSLDVEKMERLVSAAGSMKVTLHRAFDMAKDPFEALEAAKKLGIDTILTSGQEENAWEGRKLLEELAEQAGELDIMAGAGVDAGVIEKLSEETSVRAFHMSGKKTLNSDMVWRQEKVSMGLPGISEYEVFRTDAGKVEEAKGVLDKMHKNMV